MQENYHHFIKKFLQKYVQVLKLRSTMYGTFTNTQNSACFGHKIMIFFFNLEIISSMHKKNMMNLYLNTNKGGS